jgi:hypothetical protein
MGDHSATGKASGPPERPRRGGLSYKKAGGTSPRKAPAFAGEGWATKIGGAGVRAGKGPAPRYEATAADAPGYTRSNASSLALGFQRNTL